MTIDLSRTKTTPVAVAIDAYAVFRDVDIVVAAGDSVELFGSSVHGDLRNDVPAQPAERGARRVRIHGRAVLGDITVRVADSDR